MGRAAQIENVTRDGVAADSVTNIIMVVDGTTTWDGKTVVESDTAPLGADHESGQFKCEPKIDSISPTSGPAAGGTTITITGKRLDFGTLTVEVDGNPGTDIQNRLYAHADVDTPAGSVGAVDVKVKNEDGETVLTSAFTYT